MQGRITMVINVEPPKILSMLEEAVGKDKQTPQGSARTTSAVDLEEFCEKHYEKLLPIMADKYEYEQRKKEKLEEVKARLDFVGLERRALGHKSQHILNLGQCRLEGTNVLGNVKGAPECMRISEFMHGITNPELIKRFHEKIPKTVDEMMQVAISFLQGQEAASNQERKKAPPA
ncbi:hypothetical protein Tco_0825683 [Tanacetum coccineum]